MCFRQDRSRSGRRGVTAFLVEPYFPGFRVSRYEDKMGLHLSRSAEISLQDCQVPRRKSPGRRRPGPENRARIARRRPRGNRRASRRHRARRARSRRALRQAAPHFWQAHMPNFKPSNGCSRTCKPKSARARVNAICRMAARYRGARRREGYRSRIATPGAHASKAKLYSSEMANRVAYKAVQIHGSQDIRANQTSSATIATPASSPFTKAPAKFSAWSSPAICCALNLRRAI